MKWLRQFSDDRLFSLRSQCGVSDLIVQDMPYYVYNSPDNFAVASKNYGFGDMNIGSAWDWNFKNMVYASAR